jgi:hypothetical protein
MVIKNKDGTVYKVKGPNPIMLEQDLWNDFELHNMEFPDDVVNQNIAKKPTRNKINLGQTVVAKQDEIRSEVSVKTPAFVEEKPPQKKQEFSFQEAQITQEIKPPQPKIDEEEIVEKPKYVNSKLLNYPKTVLCCLPTDVQEKKDLLYGEVTTKITYGKKFTFEAILIEETDMHLLFWTHLEKIKRFAIFYPKNQEKRWWQADAIKSAPEGFVVKCIPSMQHPNF